MGERSRRANTELRTLHRVSFSVKKSGYSAGRLAHACDPEHGKWRWDGREYEAMDMVKRALNLPLLGLERVG